MIWINTREWCCISKRGVKGELINKGNFILSLLADPIVNSVLTALIGEKKKLLVIGLFKFGILATLRGRLPTKDDVKKKKKGKKEKNVEKERLSNKHL